MKSTTLLPSSLLSSILSASIAASALIGCAVDPADDHTFPGTIQQDSAAALTNAPLCDVETPCPADLECMYIGALDLDSAICVDSATVCQALDCGDGECLVLESYPAQLMCSGTPGPDDDDDDGDNDNDCSVSSDGSMHCPDTDGGGDSGTEPGNPGPA